MITVYFLVSAILYYFSTVETQQFRSDYKYYEQVGGWMKFHTIPASWHNARLRCHAEGGILASPVNEEITSILINAMKKEKVSSIFTGIHATYSKGDFFSMEGVRLLDIPLHRGYDFDQKNDDEDCMAMHPYGNLEDVRCADVFPYICYKKYDPSIPSTQNECGTVDNGYRYSKATGHCYKFNPIGQTWSRAFMTCAAEGGYLAVINNEEENRILKEQFSKYPKGIGLIGVINNAHVGFKSDEDTNFWMTNHGQSLEEAGFAVWGKGQPDNFTGRPKYADYGPQHCGTIFRFGQLDDTYCDVIAPFLCEKEPDSLKE